MIKTFLDLKVYKESFQLSLEVEDWIKKFPRNEQYLLTDQMRRASRAVPALIAEGYAKRETIAVFKKFLRDAIGEANEMINHISFAKARHYVDVAVSDSAIARYHAIGKQLTRLKDTWKNY